MRLSEAIRLGAAIKPQAFGVIRTAEKDATCAMGAAFDAIGWPTEPCPVGSGATDGRGDYTADSNTVRFILPEEWIPLFESYFECSTCSDKMSFQRCLRDHIAHLNDFHKMTREEIAALVEQYEIKQAANGAAVETAIETVEVPA